MGAKLIIDSGATKTDWALVDTVKRDVCRYKGKGINPSLLSLPEIKERIDEVFSKIKDKEISEIFFYGAGLTDDSVKEKIKKCFSPALSVMSIQAESDMLGCARALLGKNKGVACILGTGSNSCCYDGEKIVFQIPPLGYLLGDEGSGINLGKRFLNTLFKGFLPQELRNKFFETYKLDLPSIIENVYRKGNPGEFLSSITPFLKENENQPEIRNLIKEEFKNFFDKNLIHYDASYMENLRFTGSVAWHFKEELQEISTYPLTVVQYPMEALIDYHSLY